MLETTRPYGAPVRAYASAAVSFRVAAQAWQLRGYWALRREIFCAETALFGSHACERDTYDACAVPIVALSHCAGAEHEVVGVVRVYALPEPGAVWYGGRLGVSPAYRAHGRVGAGLIATAVGTAKGLGCRRFLATVLQTNTAYFERQHFSIISHTSVCDRPHALMQADLDAFAALDCQEQAA
jgi:putative N-acetyltransferase (TIGR04045 family)